jgi:translocator protein
MPIASIARLAACLALCLAVGGITGGMTAAEIPTWYAGLNQPWWTPPNWSFGVVWTVLYILMGIALWLLWERAPAGTARGSAIGLFFVQLALNAAWSPVFFSLHRPGAALVIILALVACLAALIATAWRVQRTAAWLLVPYLAWVSYATTLNAGILALNP